MSNLPSTDVELGLKYRDKVSGWTGIATGIFFYMNGCVRIALDSKDENGKPHTEVFDQEQIVRSGTAANILGEKAPKPSGGPRPAPPRR